MATLRKSTRIGLLVTVGAMVMATVVAVPLSGIAQAATTVNIPTPPFTNGQNITVSGSGFPVRSALPTGLVIIECADPGGLTANLPTDPTSQCDATTATGSQINTDTSGNFSTTYNIFALSEAGGSTINCDATDFCVLWVGQDYNNAFLSGPHGFSAPFEVNAVVSAAFESPLAIALPAAAAMVVGVYIALRRRRAHAPSAAA
jgi:hypothetical protein